MLDRLKHWMGGAAPENAPPPAGTIVIDVRSPMEHAGGALEGSINVPLSVLELKVRELVPDPATPVVLYCASGGRSGAGARLLRQMGYQHVDNAGGVSSAALRLQRAVR